MSGSGTWPSLRRNVAGPAGGGVGSVPEKAADTIRGAGERHMFIWTKLIRLACILALAPAATACAWGSKAWTAGAWLRGNGLFKREEGQRCQQDRGEEFDSHVFALYLIEAVSTPRTPNRTLPRVS